MTYLNKAAALVLGAVTVAVGLSSNPRQVKAGIDPYLGDIMIVGFSFCPRGWAEANGQLLAISQNQALFSLLGTQFGGDGRTTFGLPDLQGRFAIGEGSGPGLTPRTIGQKLGSETTNMTEATMAAHSHMVNANNLDGNRPGPGGKLLAAAPPGGAGSETIYSTLAPNVTMNSAMIGHTGQGGAINIQDPSLTLIHCIAIQGTFPSRN